MDLAGADSAILTRITSFLVSLNLFVLFVCKYKIIPCKIFMKDVPYHVLPDIKVKLYRSICTEIKQLAKYSEFKLINTLKS